MLVICSDPLAAFVPDQPSLAAQDPALVVVQLSTVLPPVVMSVGTAENASVGGCSGGLVVPPPPASLPQPASSRTAKPVQARPGLLSRITPYTHARGRRGVGTCRRWAPGAIV